jgi:protein ImuB
VRLEANPVKPRAAQNGLFVPVAPEPVKLELTIARIEALVGRTHRLARVDRHAPSGSLPHDEVLARRVRRGAGACTASGAWPCSVFRPARAARVTLERGQPDTVQAEGIRGRIVSMAGPWRTSGDWWTGDPFARDEWTWRCWEISPHLPLPARVAVEGSYD